MFRKVSGTKDILPDEVCSWQKIEKISRDVFTVYNYKEIRPPIIEEAALFNRSLGEFTEIVQKQMFLIRNRDELYALRPEGTASVVRAYIENNLDKTCGLMKLYYMGPMFRLERPQKGRLRQFHHIGTEVIGSSSPDIDVEVITLAVKLLNSYGVSGYKTIVNSLGCDKDKKELVKILQDALKGKLGDLCEECKVRFNHNILRVLDCKKETCREIIRKINLKHGHLCEDCSKHFKAVKTGLDILGIKYEVSEHLVRGLDYYTRTVFEIRHGQLGAQDAIGAGGRYDSLVKELGGPDIGAIGFAFGVERLLLIAKTDEHNDTTGDLVYLIPLGDKAKLAIVKILGDLRDAGFNADTDYQNKSLKGAMRTAGDLGARFVGILGENELSNKAISIKDMVSGEQEEVQINDLVNKLRTKG